MEAKLTLKLDLGAIRKAKSYVRGRRGASLSRLVENYFNSLTRVQEEGFEKLPPIVSSLAGVAKKSNKVDFKEDYADYLTKKYK